MQEPERAWRRVAGPRQAARRPAGGAGGAGRVARARGPPPRPAGGLGGARRDAGRAGPAAAGDRRGGEPVRGLQIQRGRQMDELLRVIRDSAGVSPSGRPTSRRACGTGSGGAAAGQRRPAGPLRRGRRRVRAGRHPGRPRGDHPPRRRQPTSRSRPCSPAGAGSWQARRCCGSWAARSRSGWCPGRRTSRSGRPRHDARLGGADAGRLGDVREHVLDAGDPARAGRRARRGAGRGRLLDLGRGRRGGRRRLGARAAVRPDRPAAGDGLVGGAPGAADGADRRWRREWRCCSCCGWSGAADAGSAGGRRALRDRALERAPARHDAGRVHLVAGGGRVRRPGGNGGGRRPGGLEAGDGAAGLPDRSRRAGAAPPGCRRRAGADLRRHARPHRPPARQQPPAALERALRRRGLLRLRRGLHLRHLPADRSAHRPVPGRRRRRLRRVAGGRPGDAGDPAGRAGRPAAGAAGAGGRWRRPGRC